jgi:hypothetical protein
MERRLNHASNRLEDHWALLRILESAQDALTFKPAFAALWVVCRSIPVAINRELKSMLRKGKGTPEGKNRPSEYDSWFKAKLKQRQEKDSLGWIFAGAFHTLLSAIPIISLEDSRL